MKLSAAILILAAAGTTQANPVIWDNWGTYDVGLSSQNDTAYPFDSQLADDFMFAAPGYYVTDVEWYGVFWNQGYPGFQPTFNIYFYADDGTGNFPTTPAPGSALAAYYGLTANATFVATDQYTYDVDLPTPFMALPDQKYWIAIQAEMIFPPQWGWATQPGIAYGANAKQGFPFLGTPYWSDPGYGDAIWRLSGYEIPAPGSLALLGLGALVARRRR